MRQSHKIIIGVVVVYLAIGVLFYSTHLKQELRTYECEGVTIFNNSYQPPQANCTRRAFQIEELGTAVGMITLWPMLIIGQVLFD